MSQRPVGRAPGPIWRWEISGDRRWFMKPSLLRLQDGSFEVMLGPIQIIRDAWGMRIHLTWPILLTITLTGVRENCGRFGCYGYKPDPTPVSTPHYPTPPCH